MFQGFVGGKCFSGRLCTLRRLFLPALCAWFLSLLFMSVFAGSVSAKSNVDGGRIYMEGIDVSRWQGDIDWQSVKNDGIDFVMVGMGRYYNDGTTFLDPYFRSNVINAEKCGLKVGVYLFSLAKTVEHAKAEAKWVLEQIDGYRISFPVAFDMEDESVASLSTEVKTDIALVFLETIREAGYYPMMYASENWFYDGIDLTRLTKYDKWVARWREGMTFNPVSIWQYTSTGSVSGISGNVDRDHCYRDYTSIITPRYHAEKASYTRGWHSNENGYWYFLKSGRMLRNEFRTLKKKRYYFDENGFRVTGWKKIGGKYYYFDEDGVMQKGWLRLNGKKYYLDPKTGVRAKGWTKIGKKTYYFRKRNGVMFTQWHKLGGKWYYFHKTKGYMFRNRKKGEYILGKDGACTNRE